MFESNIKVDYCTETKQYKINMGLQNGESVEFTMTEFDILGMLKAFSNILYKSKLEDE